MNPFDQNTKLTDEQKRAIETVRIQFKTLYEIMDVNLPTQGYSYNAYRGKALEALEESAMWFNKAITHG